MSDLPEQIVMQLSGYYFFNVQDSRNKKNKKNRAGID